LVILNSGGHSWPSESPSDIATAENPLRFGLKNQDINAEEVLWDWLKTKKRVK
jgi:poly(3-hydroxybutyrate) depolymerase